MSSPFVLRRQQQAALAALDDVYAGGTARAWVVLPPGVGKTLVGAEVIRRLGSKAVVLCPNIAIQQQWVKTCAMVLPGASVDDNSTLVARVSVLNYQSVASFEESDEAVGAEAEGQKRSLVDSLHPNGVAIVDRMKASGALTIVLDECHHLMEKWGQLLDEILTQLPHARVLALTATPPSSLSSEQFAMSNRLFGANAYTSTMPAAVKEQHLAPFHELPWLCEPTKEESQWLQASSQRFLELQNDLLDVSFANVPFLEWLVCTFVDRRDPLTSDVSVLSWQRTRESNPEAAAAILRFHHVGLLALPEGAEVHEQHRKPPALSDWIALLTEYVNEYLRPSSEQADKEALNRIRAALPSVGFQLTAKGIRASSSPADRVVARSRAKSYAALDIVSAESSNLGSELRALVLCDFQGATRVPQALTDVLSAEAGSTLEVLRTLVADPGAAHLAPVVVTGSTVITDSATAEALMQFIGECAPTARPEPKELGNNLVSMLAGPGWSSRVWTPLLTRFHSEGHSKVLIGTRSLLGEGWDAPAVNVLIDLTCATTPTAVVQMRGRAVRLDPDRPDKVATNWTVACITDSHPRGAADWDRLVRKHEGYLSVTAEGEIAGGVTHLDPEFSPFAPPDTANFDRLNSRSIIRSENRPLVRALWRIGQSFRDQVLHTIRIHPTRSLAKSVVSTEPVVPVVVPTARGVIAPKSHVQWWGPFGAGVAGLVAPLTIGAPSVAGLVAAAAGASLVGVAVEVNRRGNLLQAATSPPDFVAFAHAVRDAMRAGGMLGADTGTVATYVELSGAYRFTLEEASTEASAVFAHALEELVSPLASPRYLVPRYQVPEQHGSLPVLRRGIQSLLGRTRNDVTYHAVPTVFGVNKALAVAFAASWHRWVSGGELLYCRSPEGRTVLELSQGRSPLDLTTAMRVAWE